MPPMQSFNYKCGMQHINKWGPTRYDFIDFLGQLNLGYGTTFVMPQNGNDKQELYAPTLQAINDIYKIIR